MNEKFYQFKIGRYTCYLVSDGKHRYNDPASLLFPNAPRARLAEELSAYGIDPSDWAIWTSDYTCLIIDTGSQMVLIDTGAGSLVPEAGKLVENMQSAGIHPKDIDQVLLSHAHPDHSGGSVNFPEAQIIMHRNEWRFWISRPKLPRLPRDFRKMLTGMITPLLSAMQGRVELIDRDTEVLPGIKTLAAFGHTPGHQAISVCSENEALLYTGDAILHPVHVKKPHWSAIVDVIPDKAEMTRKRLLSYAADHEAAVFGFHFPHFGKISQPNLKSTIDETAKKLNR